MVRLQNPPFPPQHKAMGLHSLYRTKWQLTVVPGKLLVLVVVVESGSEGERGPLFSSSCILAICSAILASSNSLRSSSASKSRLFDDLSSASWILRSIASLSSSLCRGRHSGIPWITENLYVPWQQWLELFWFPLLLPSSFWHEFVLLPLQSLPSHWAGPSSSEFAL